ncbi:MAG: hypothetical protein JSS10_08745 [Verrucomicrobia bacterium]|nr:hypothetical protein [Verrucomicrobiota bacterium]
MSIMGISEADLQHVGWNLTVAAGVAFSCGLLARRVTIFAHWPIHKYIKTPTDSPKVEHVLNISRWMGVAAGMGAAGLLQWTMSGSRLGFIHNPSLDKMFKFAAGQALLGLVLDRWIQTHRPLFIGFGVAIACADHWSRYSLLGMGALGALAGGAKI